MANVRIGFKKFARLDVLATFGATGSSEGWRKSAKGISHFAQANQSSVRAILEAVGEQYFISKDPEDYIFAVYRAVTEDEPNGNGDAFPREELISWNRNEHKPVYRTFEFKPRFVNHAADDPRMARGVCLDVHYNELDPDDRFIEVLVCYDTKKDPILARAVAEGLITQCSMGCDALKTECNVCDNVAYSDKDYCTHIKPGNRLKMHRSPSGEMKLAFERCYDVTFQELSDVDDPADKKADIQEIMAVDSLTSAKIASESEMLRLNARIKRLESTQASLPSFQMAASLGDGMAKQGEASPKQAAKKAVPEHHTVAAIYAKQHDLSFGDPHKAMEETMKETGKTDQEIQACWSKKMAEDAPHPHHDAICASLNAQLLACGDMKKAIKRAAEDHQVDHDTVEKCAEHMKHSNKMPQAKAAAEAPLPVEDKKAADAPAPVAAAEPAPVVATGAPAADAPAAAEDKKAAEPKEDGPPPEVQEKIDESAKTAARKLSALTFEDVKNAMWDAQMHDPEEDAELSGPAKVLFDADCVENAGQAMKCLRDSGLEVGDLEVEAKIAKKAKIKAKKAQDGEIDAKKAEDAAEEAKKAQAAPAAPAPVAAGPVEDVQAADAPNDKSLGDMGVKTSAEVEKKDEEKEAAKTAAQFPFADFYKDVEAKRVASGAVHVTRAGKLMFTVPAENKVAAKEALEVVASIGLVAAMKKLSMKKSADLGVAEGAISDAKGGRPLPPQSIQDGAVSNAKEKPAASPASTTAQGATTDMKDKVDTKSISNSDVRDGASTDTKAGLSASADSVVDKGENTNAKDKHAPKNVGSDNILAQRQVDFLTKGLDPKSAALVRARLAKIAAEPADEKEKEATRKAQEDEKDKAAKKADDDKEMEKKSELLAQAKLAKFVRGLRLVARRFALNLEPCHLKYSLGEVLSTRHEASGFEGMDGDLVCDLVMRGLPLHASLEHIDHMTKRAAELAAMPEDSLKAIEADAENLEPVHPQAQADSPEEAGHESKSAQLRRRAANGSMPLLRSPEAARTEIPTKQSLLRQAIGGGILGSKYSGRH